MRRPDSPDLPTIANGLHVSSDRLDSFHEEPSVNPDGFRAALGLENIARRTLGIFLLLVTVFLWTASNFLASYIFADNTFSKPYFVTYVNSSLFASSLLPVLLRAAYQRGISNIWASIKDYWQGNVHNYWRRKRADIPWSSLDGTSESHEVLLAREDLNGALKFPSPELGKGMLSFPETAKISFEFCLLWFIANYLASACLEYTSVASSTILTSTSGIWTLIFGAIIHVERFSAKKLLGVLASLAGIILISMADLSSESNDDSRGSFPHKSQAEIATGDAMAFCSAIMYGIYTVVMKKRIGNEERVNMPLFFGLVGLFNVIFLWPGFLILHFTGIEQFELPPTNKIWTIIIVNSISSFISDFCWAYAMLLTTPLVVTVGLSMSIPLSLIGQMILQSQYSSVLYWIGAVVVVLSFAFINHESRE